MQVDQIFKLVFVLNSSSPATLEIRFFFMKLDHKFFWATCVPMKVIQK